MGRGRTAKLVVLLLVVAGLARAAILYWSPYPATLDGFFYVRAVETVGATGYVPTPIDWDRVAMAAFLRVASAVFGVAPLRLLQPLSAVVGAGVVLPGVVLLWRLGRDRWGLSASRLRVGTLVVGGVVALDGVLVRRTGVPDEELLGLLLVPVVAYAFHRWLRSGQRRWGVVTGLVVVLLPVVHTLSTTVALLAMLAVAAVHVASGWRRAVAGRAAVGVGLGAASALAYYRIAVVRPALTVSYVDRLFAAPQLLAAWVLLLVVVTPWLVRTSVRIQRVVVGGNLVGWVGLLLVNATTPVYIGTVPTPPLLLVLVVPLVVVIVAAGMGVDRVADRAGAGAAVLGLLLGPVVLGDFFLTAGLAPDFFGALVRVQTFAHLPVAVVAGALVATRFPWGAGVVEREQLGRAVVAVLVVGAMVTAPVGLLALDTATVPGTTTPVRLAGVEFAAERAPGNWSAGYPETQVAGLSFGSNANLEPAVDWAVTGTVPSVPVLASGAWSTRGVQRYPQAPANVGSEAYDRWLASSSVVYTASGTETDEYRLSLPVRGAESN